MSHPTPLADGCIYSPHADHWNGNPNKSQWSVHVADEISTFTYGAHMQWVDEQGIHWGLHLIDGRAAPLGRSRVPFCEPTVLARSRGTIPDIHGYPADPVQHNADRPPPAITRKWLALPEAARPLTKKTINDLAQGKSCGL